jgi:hypothetical protein
MLLDSQEKEDGTLQLLELEKIFEETWAHHWDVISNGPLFLHGYMVSSGPGSDPQITAVEEHYLMAVLRDDIDVRIAWGYDPNFGRGEEDTYFKEHAFADPKVSAELGDVFYRGALVQRHWLLSVDSGRALLPMPTRRLIEGADLMSRDPNDYELFVTQPEVNFARLLNDLRKTYDDFGSYLRRSNFVIDPY